MDLLLGFFADLQSVTTLVLAYEFYNQPPRFQKAKTQTRCVPSIPHLSCDRMIGNLKSVSSIGLALGIEPECLIQLANPRQRHVDRRELR